MKNNELSFRARLLLGLAAVSVLTSFVLLMPAQAQAPKIITYQGRLKENGDPVNMNKDMTFRIFDVLSGGTALYTEAHTGGSNIFVENGLFSTTLGELVTIPDGLFDGTDRYLEIQVDAAVLTPRERLTAAAFTLRAGTAAVVVDGSVTSSKLVDGAVTSSKLANLSVTSAKLADFSVTSAKLADSAVTTQKLTPEVAWVFLGGSKLGSAAASIDLSGLANRRFLQVRVYSAGLTSPGRTGLEFNGDNGNNYESTAGGLQDKLLIDGSGNTLVKFATVDLFNLDGQYKLATILGMEFVDTANDPVPYTQAGQWEDNGAGVVINRITLVNDVGNFNAGTEIQVFGRN